MQFLTQEELKRFFAVIINDRKVGPWTQRIYDTLTGIQQGILPDCFSWMVSV